ncbi:MAG: energy transducer TonB [Bacteroidetes bacterium]|nr:energy transducer TonB [Bacteroidota bacterium]
MTPSLNAPLLLCMLLTMFSIQTVRAQELVTVEEEEVFTVVEDMPVPWLYKTTCLDVRSIEKRDCYMEELNLWLSKQLVYPDKAIRNETEGDVVTQFIVDKTGAIRDLVILKDIGDGCGNAAIRALEGMPDWIPGRQRGVPVNVRYTIPVRFDLK